MQLLVLLQNLNGNRLWCIFYHLVVNSIQIITLIKKITTKNNIKIGCKRICFRIISSQCVYYLTEGCG